MMRWKLSSTLVQNWSRPKLTVLSGSGIAGPQGAMPWLEDLLRPLKKVVEKSETNFDIDALIHDIFHIDALIHDFHSITRKRLWGRKRSSLSSRSLQRSA